MSLITRELPVAEWPRLTGTALEGVDQTLPPEWATVLVVENEAGEIVGTLVLMTIVHAEGLWIHPDHRGKAAVGRRLMTGMDRVAQRAGVAKVVAVASDEEMGHLFTHFGASRVVGESFLIPITGSQKE